MKKFALLAGMAIASLLVTAPAEARNLNVVIINDSHETMTHLYGSNRDRSGWENDIFGDGVLGPHERVIVDFEDNSGYCIFDIKVRWADGNEAIAWNRNVCELNSLTFSN